MVIRDNGEGRPERMHAEVVVGDICCIEVPSDIAPAVDHATHRVGGSMEG